MDNKEALYLTLIEKVQKEGGRAFIDAIFSHYKDDFEKAAMYHFNRHPFNYKMAALPNSNKEKQSFVFAEAYFGFQKAIETFDPSIRLLDQSERPFATWMNHNIEWRFEDKSEKQGIKYMRKRVTLDNSSENNISLGRYVQYGKATVWRQFDTDNHEPDPLESNAVDVTHSVLEAISKEEAIYNKVAMLLQTYVEGYENRSEAARRLGISNEAVRRACLSTPKKLPPKILAAAREKWQQI